MRVLIKKVKIGSYYDVTGEIGDFWIEGKLKSGRTIRIFDSHPYDLRDFINKEVDCLIWAGFVKPINLELNHTTNIRNTFTIIGEFIEEYKIESKWKNYEGNRFTSALQTSDGYFLFDKEYLKNKLIKNGEEISLKAVRYDLLDWNPLF